MNKELSISVIERTETLSLSLCPSFLADKAL